MKPIALALVLFAACGDNSNHKKPDAMPDASPLPPRAIVVAGDFTAGHPGVLSVLDLTSRTVMPNVGPAMAVGDDPVIRKVGNELFVINRGDGNNVTIVDATTLTLVEQLGTGASSNPQDVAVVGDKLFVPTFGTKGVTMLTRGSQVTKVIDLSADDPDGKPNCNSAYTVGTDVYVSCELLDDTMQFLPPRGPGKVYVIDSVSGTVTHTVTLGHKNPFGTFEVIPAPVNHGGDLLIPTVFFDDGSGCIERVSVGANPASGGCIVDNTKLGGYASRIDFDVEAGAVVMFAAVPAPDFMHAALRGFDMQTLDLWADPLNPMTEVIGDVAMCADGVIVMSDTTMNANGLRVYQGTAELTTAPLPIGLKPTSSHGLICY